MGLFKEAVDQSVKKEVKQLKASQTKTASAMPESTEIPSVKISEHPQSSKHMSSIKPSKTYCSKHSKTACTKHKTSPMKHSTKIKPSKTRTMMPSSHVVTKRPVVESNEIV